MIWLFPIVPLLLLALWPVSYEKSELLRPAISLQEAKEKRFPKEEWRGTPLTPLWKDLLERAEERGWRGSTNGPRSGIRSYTEQKRFYRLWKRGRGAPAFPPSGPSRHMMANISRWGQWSQAVDVSRPGELVRIAKTLGVPLYAPYPPEPWHIEARHVFSLPAERQERTVEKTILPLSGSLSLALLLAGTVLWFRGLKEKRAREREDSQERD